MGTESKSKEAANQFHNVHKGGFHPFTFDHFNYGHEGGNGGAGKQYDQKRPRTQKGADGAH